MHVYMSSKITKAAVNYKIKYLCIAYVDHMRSAFQIFFFFFQRRDHAEYLGQKLCT